MRRIVVVVRRTDEKKKPSENSWNHHRTLPSAVLSRLQQLKNSSKKKRKTHQLNHIQKKTLNKSFEFDNDLNPSTVQKLSWNRYFFPVPHSRTPKPRIISREKFLYCFVVREICEKLFFFLKTSFILRLPTLLFRSFVFVGFVSSNLRHIVTSSHPGLFYILQSRNLYSLYAKKYSISFVELPKNWI